jgi:dTDP-4-dehydrorhamnose 3,5-epimerase
MEKCPTQIDGAWILKPTVYSDERGFFMETWNQSTFSKLGLNVCFMQDNHSRSAKSVLRGLHYQVGTSAQGKLVWVTAGTVFDVIVDLRRSSPSFGRWYGYLLDAEKHHRLWVPPGCAHGFLVTSQCADFHYKVTKGYDPLSERCLLWNDKQLSIAWPLGEEDVPILSAKDLSGEGFAVCPKFD